MKNAIGTLILAMAFVTGAHGHVTDFNALIDENVAAQKQLHTEVKSHVDETRAALIERPASKTIVVESDGEVLNVRTNKKFMRFKKEVVNHQVKDKKLEKRLANEFKSLEMEF